MKNLQWKISAVQTGQPLNQLEWHFVYIATPRLVLVLLDDEPDDDGGGNIMAAASEKNYRAMLHRDGMTSAQSLARIRAMPRFNRLGFEQGIEPRQTSYQPVRGASPMTADKLMLSASGMLKLAVIFAQEFTGTPWQILSRFLDGQDRGNAMRFLDNVAASQQGKPVGSVVRFTLPEIARFDPAALMMMQPVE